MMIRKTKRTPVKDALLSEMNRIGISLEEISERSQVDYVVIDFTMNRPEDLTILEYVLLKKIIMGELEG